MAKKISIKATLSDNINKTFRLQTKVYHIIYKHKDFLRFPIIINNFNRLQYLVQQIDWLLNAGHTNIHIIDNGSTYDPLLRFYNKCPATVYMLNKNVGHESLWKTHLHQRFGKYYHVYTDPDVLPDENTPIDFMYYFKSLLDKYPAINKVGFGLHINDLPDYYPKKQEVINWESKMYTDEIESSVYKSKIDTTFALYRPESFLQCWDSTLRTGGNYMLKHMPWYENPLYPNEETLFYMNAMSKASSWYNTVLGSDKRYDE